MNEIVTDKPFRLSEDTTRTRWFKDGELHREDGPAVEWSDGGEEWYLNGQRHRTDGPAVIFTDGTKSWWLNGNRHRDDGPAVIFADGSKEWWLNDKEYTEKKYNKLMSQAVAKQLDAK